MEDMMRSTAGEATIKTLRDESVYDKIGRLGERARTRLSEIFDRSGFDAQVTGIGSLFGIHFTEQKPVRDIRYFTAEHRRRSKRLFASLLNSGILVMAPDLIHAAISGSHSEDEIDALVSRVEEFVETKN